MSDIYDRRILFSNSYFSTTATLIWWQITMDKPDGIPFQNSLKRLFVIYLGAKNWIPDTLGYLNGCLFIWHQTSLICLVSPIAFKNWSDAIFIGYTTEYSIFCQNKQATFIEFSAFMPT